MAIQWTLKKFEDLSAIELYKIMQLRNEVFVVEQNCVYQDADNKDISSWQFMGWDNEKLVAFTRLLPPGLAYEQASIGRVVTSPSASRLEPSPCSHRAATRRSCNPCAAPRHR